jgi:Saxitoxin biosynthesis operon protein SxtJ
MDQPKVTSKMLRSFGFLMGGVLSVFTLIFAYKDFPRVAGVLALIASCFILFALLAPDKLAKVNAGWMKFGEAIGKFNAKIILGFMFLSIFSVFHFFLVLLRKDFLKRKLEPSAESYWEKRETSEINVARYEKQY